MKVEDLFELLEEIEKQTNQHCRVTLTNGSQPIEIYMANGEEYVDQDGDAFFPDRYPFYHPVNFDLAEGFLYRLKTAKHAPEVRTQYLKAEKTRLLDELEEIENELKGSA